MFLFHNWLIVQCNPFSLMLIMCFILSIAELDIYWVFVFSLHKDVFHSCQIKWEHFVFLSLSHTQQSKKHANKVRLFYMLHPEDGGPPSKRLRPDNPVFSLTCIYY